MKTTNSVIVLLFIFLTTTCYAAENSQSYLLNFPKINLDADNGERVEEIHLSVSCGHIEAIEAIPYDWNIKIVRAISGVEEFHSSAGHGTSMLTDIRTMNNSFRIRIGEKECFDVTATVVTYIDEKNRKMELPLSKLKLTPIKQKE